MIVRRPPHHIAPKPVLRVYPRTKMNGRSVDDGNKEHKEHSASTCTTTARADTRKQTARTRYMQIGLREEHEEPRPPPRSGEHICASFISHPPEQSEGMRSASAKKQATREPQGIALAAYARADAAQYDATYPSLMCTRQTTHLYTPPRTLPARIRTPENPPDMRIRTTCSPILVPTLLVDDGAELPRLNVER
ncbi:hypothetical protein B0H16DRAFT_1898916 [Mycena metata]|uniref:Uncharacterized protein n=1 Tax=Mycena metata TaxID=1033252 RepID=A0AAD7MFX0_9AGAR|nr:hypothetical protein B0H16DRAFT_1898916 [Mycena metata]